MEHQLPSHENWTYNEDPDGEITHAWTHNDDSEREVWLSKKTPTGKYTKFDWGIGLVTGPGNGYKPFPPETFDSEEEAFEWAKEVMEQNPSFDNPLRKLALPEADD